jgi:hypothetical protein
MVPKSSSPRRSICLPASPSSSSQGIRTSISDIKFNHGSRSRPRRRHRSSSASNGNNISFSSTNDTDEDLNLWHSEHQASSSSQPAHRHPVPLRAPLRRVSDPPVLHDSRVFRAPSPGEDGPLFTYASLPPTPITSTPPPPSNAERYKLPPEQSDVYTPPFSLWDYLREELLVTDFDSHQELKWERVSNFLSIPIAIEKVSGLGAADVKYTPNHLERSYPSALSSALTRFCTHSQYSPYVSPLLSGDSLQPPLQTRRHLYHPPRKLTF